MNPLNSSHRVFAAAALVAGAAGLLAPVALAVQPVTSYVLDDGAGSASGIGFAGEWMWGNVFTAAPAGRLITSVSATFANIPDGTPIKVYVFEDPTDDFDPSDAVLVSTATGVSARPFANAFITYPVPPVVVSGTFYAGVSMVLPDAFTRPARQDFNVFGPTSQSWSFLSSPTLNTANLGANTQIRQNSAIGIGVWMVRAEGAPLPADFNADGVVNDDDLSEFLTAYYEALAGPTGYAVFPCPGADVPYDTDGYRADFTRDCSLNDDDLGAFLTAYFGS